MGKIVRALSADGSAFCAAVDSTDIINEMAKIHGTSPVASAALGRFLTAGSLMGSLLKNETDTLTMRMKGGGPGGIMTVVADFKGNVKGYTSNPEIDLPLAQNGKLNVGGYVGRNGFLAVVKDLGLKEPYATQTPIVSGEVAEDITSYYAVSEQIPTVCALGVLVDRDYSIKAAGGYLIQLIPPINETAIDFIEKNIEKMQSVTDMLGSGATAEEISLQALEGLDGNVLDSWEIAYKCGCSRERTCEMLISLGKDELKKLSENNEKDKIEVCCHFCSEKYYFSSSEIVDMIRE